jgi:hypothetical protein
MSHAVVEKKQELAGPPRAFWEDDLELGMENALALAQAPGFMEDWIGHRTGRQLNVLFGCLGLETNQSARRKKQVLRPDNPGLQPFVLVEQFAKFKSKVAVADLARGLLPQRILDACRVDAEDFDKVALLFAMYRRHWQNLRLVFHLDKIHKTGFARMLLHEQVRRPRRTLKAFLQLDAVRDILVALDKAKGDGRASELKDVVVHDGRHLVFIRRAERPDHILHAGQMVHGYRPEWIILDFTQDAKRVNISSVSVSVPLEIANRLASGYFHTTCEYENECQITYAKQLEHFLKTLQAKDDGDLVLVEIVVTNSPLDGAPKFKISDADSKPIGRAIAHFERAVGKLLAHVDHIDSVKVRYRKKRISLIFERQEGSDGEYVVRYSDHRLNAGERRRFEELIRSAHGIEILSTEKRFKQ